MKTITRAELDKKLELHELWLNNQKGGERLDLSGANLRNVDLRFAYLRFANLRDADLRDADLRNADLRNASLSDANLRDADLRNASLSDANLRFANLSNASLSDANLRNVDLWSTIGNGKEIKSLQLGTYDITYTKDRLQIGCKNFSFEEWFNFTDEEIATMDSQALERWSKYKEYIKMTIELLPAI